MIFHDMLVHLFSILENFRTQPAVVQFFQALNERLKQVSRGLRVGVISPKATAKFSAGSGQVITRCIVEVIFTVCTR